MGIRHSGNRFPTPNPFRGLKDAISELAKRFAADCNRATTGSGPTPTPPRASVKHGS